jgi:hypothetical protein
MPSSRLGAPPWYLKWYLHVSTLSLGIWTNPCSGDANPPCGFLLGKVNSHLSRYPRRGEIIVCSRLWGVVSPPNPTSLTHMNRLICNERAGQLDPDARPRFSTPPRRIEYFIHLRSSPRDDPARHFVFRFRFLAEQRPPQRRVPFPILSRSNCARQC